MHTKQTIRLLALSAVLSLLTGMFNTEQQVAGIYYHA